MNSTNKSVEELFGKNAVAAVARELSLVQMRRPTWVYDDGGRKAADFKSKAKGDCVIRAIAIAIGEPYAKIHNDLTALINSKRFDRFYRRQKAGQRDPAHHGVPRLVYEPYLQTLGWDWVPTMWMGSGCKVHLVAKELPSGRIIARLSRHISLRSLTVLFTTTMIRRAAESAACMATSLRRAPGHDTRAETAIGRRHRCGRSLPGAGSDREAVASHALA
jgi:hypothetical protein